MSLPIKASNAFPHRLNNTTTHKKWLCSSSFVIYIKLSFSVRSWKDKSMNNTHRHTHTQTHTHTHAHTHTYTHAHTHTHTHTLTWYLWKVVKLFAWVKHGMSSPTEETNPFRPILVICISTLYDPEYKFSSFINCSCAWEK